MNNKKEGEVSLVLKEQKQKGKVMKLRGGNRTGPIGSLQVELFWTKKKLNRFKFGSSGSGNFDFKLLNFKFI